MFLIKKLFLNNFFKELTELRLKNLMLTARMLAFHQTRHPT